MACRETGCLREKMDVPSGQRREICRGLHAEQNVIIQAAVHGLVVRGADIYCTNHPCVLLRQNADQLRHCADLVRSALSGGLAVAAGRSRPGDPPYRVEEMHIKAPRI